MIVLIINMVLFGTRQHYPFNMARVYLILALVIQSVFVLAIIDDNEEEIESRKVLMVKPNEIDDDVVKDFHGAKQDWMDMFLTPNENLFPTSSAAIMAQVTNNNRSAEEQLEDIKEMADKITLAIQSEMANLLAYALTTSEDSKVVDENGLRKRRSIETPMDSTQLVMRLLKHIKSNNEYQNIAIEKMMTAQEIADKYGIEFNPDTEILSDLAVAANEHANDLNNLLKDACETKNVTEKVEFVPLEQYVPKIENSAENNTYFVYALHDPHHENQQKICAQQIQNSFPPHEYSPEPIHNIKPVVNHAHYPDHTHYNYYYNYPYETQIMSPPVYQPEFAPVTPRPNYYDSMMAFTPAPEYQPYCIEPITTTTTIILPIEEPVQLEPELVGEEYEEVVSSKVIVERDEEPGSATVNHVMTYTLSEKAHFRTPQIESLPQQMQYSFFLM